MENPTVIKIVIDCKSHDAYFDFVIDCCPLRKYISGHKNPEYIKQELLNLIDNLKRSVDYELKDL